MKMSNESLCAEIQNGRTEYILKLIKKNERFIYGIALEFSEKCKGYEHFIYDHEDLLQEARIKFSEAAYKFDIAGENLFLTFAGEVIRNHLTDIFRSQCSRFESRLSRGEIDDLKELNLSTSVNGSENDQGEAAPDIYTGFNPYSDPTGNRAIRENMYEELYYCISSLSNREQSFVCYHYGFTGDGNNTIADTARHFGIRKSRVVKLNRDAVENIRKQFRYYESDNAKKM